MEQAVSLLHAAKAANASEKEAKFDNLLTYVRGVRAAPALFEELLPLVLEMQSEDNVHVRSFVVQFIEESCKRLPQLLPQAVTALLEFSRSEDITVLTKAMKAVAVLFRKTLVFVCSEEYEVDSEDAIATWNCVKESFASMRTHVTHTSAKVRNSSVLMIQRIAIALGSSEQNENPDIQGEEENAEESWTINCIPPCHPVLDFAELKALGQECVNQLLSLLDPSSSTPFQTMLCAINCLGRIARNQPVFLGEIEPVLSAACRNLTNVDAWQLSSLKSTVKSTMLALLKLPRCSAYAAVLVDRLISLGASTQAEAARRIMEKEKHKTRHSAPGRNVVKRQADPRLQDVSANKRARNAPAPLIDLERIPQGKPPEEWPPELVTELVLAAMVNFPPALPPHLIDVADTPLGMWPERLAFPGAHAKPINDAAREAEVAEDASAANVSSIRSKTLQSARPLKKDTIQQLTQEAVLRILHGESAAWSIRNNVLAKLIAMGDVCEGLEEEIVKYLLVAYAERHELAVQILHEVYLSEHASVAERKGPKERYWRLLHAVIEGLLNHSEGENAQGGGETRFLTKLLSEVPAIQDKTMTIVSSLCDNENVKLRQVGLSCLRALIINRPACRSECLQKLLGYTIWEDDSIRSTAIRLVANKLFSVSFLTADIQSFAVSNMRKACKVDESDDVAMKDASAGDEGDEGKAGIHRHLLHLFLALCAQNHELLHDLIETYVKASGPVRTAVQGCIGDMVKAIGPESPVLLQVISDFPQGAEILMLAFVRTLTDGGNVGQHAKLIESVKTLYSRTGDARFMIYIWQALSRNEIESLLPKIVSLPQVGVKAALSRVLHCRPPPIAPEKLMVALHKLAPSGKELTMKKIADSIEICFNERAIFTTQVLAVVLQQLMDQNPLPQLYMRTVLVALKASPSLTDFVMGILSRLISKQVWNMPTLWEGFVKCCRQTLPRSLPVLVQLPPQQLAKALQACKDLGPPMAQHVQERLAKGYPIPHQIIAQLEPWLERGYERRESDRPHEEMQEHADR